MSSREIVSRHQYSEIIDKLDSKTRSYFEIVAAYFVKVFFFDIYNHSECRVNSNETLTDIYRKSTLSYTTAVKTQKDVFNKVINTLFNYYRSLKKTPITYSEFVKNYLFLFVPDEYCSRLTTKEIDEFFGYIICCLLAELTAYCTSPKIISKIIDLRKDNMKFIIRELQDQCVNILACKKDELHNHFIKIATGAKSGGSNDLARRLYKENSRLKKKIEKQEEKIAELSEYVEQLESDKKRYRRKMKKMEVQIGNMTASMENMQKYNEQRKGKFSHQSHYKTEHKPLKASHQPEISFETLDIDDNKYSKASNEKKDSSMNFEEISFNDEPSGPTNESESSTGDFKLSADDFESFDDSSLMNAINYDE